MRNTRADFEVRVREPILYSHTVQKEKGTGLLAGTVVGDCEVPHGQGSARNIAVITHRLQGSPLTVSGETVAQEGKLGPRLILSSAQSAWVRELLASQRKGPTHTNQFLCVWGRRMERMYLGCHDNPSALGAWEAWETQR